MSAGLRILLIRHGETHGYYDNVGLTPVGEEQAHVKAKELAPQLPAGANVSISHAPTARATATASVLRASLVAELAEDARTTIGALEVDPLFDSLQFLFDGAARESTGVAAARVRLRESSDDRPGADRLPDWAAEYDRFDTDLGEAARAGGPIDRWMTATTLHFEPPQVAVYRAWAGIRQLARNAGSAPMGLVVSHSALLRAFAAAAFGTDHGEPVNLEHVTVDVEPGGGLAQVGYRGHEVTVEVPTLVPPWLNPDYIGGDRRGLPLP
ncbi:MAG: Phosphoglycerate mutase [Pseudonocardia sp.]|jgi:broad specificity phosphatase PhoE|nr:Phosphoglycerate mutase [Pseudonocardia sp.]